MLSGSLHQVQDFFRSLFTACERTQDGGRRGFQPPHKANRINTGFSPGKLTQSRFSAARVTQTVQQPANMCWMIADAEALLNQVGHAGASPVAGIQTRLLRQRQVEFPHGARIQPPRPAYGWLGAQSLAAFSSDYCSPAPQAPSIHPHQPRHLHRRKPLRKQNEGAKSPPLQLFR